MVAEAAIGVTETRNVLPLDTLTLSRDFQSKNREQVITSEGAR
jgi:hypothetical protein